MQLIFLLISKLKFTNDCNMWEVNFFFFSFKEHKSRAFFSKHKKTKNQKQKNEKKKQKTYMYILMNFPLRN